VYALQKVVRQVFQLLWCLLVSIPQPDAILVQNPPSIPTLILVFFVCFLRDSKFVIDWHNFGYTILGLKLSPSHPLVVTSRIYERFAGKFADAGLCVTRAMKDWLSAEWGIEANVLYDRPPVFFRRTTTEERHDLFSRLEKEFLCVDGKRGKGKTLFTDGPKSMRADRPLLAISSTSWTPDEDFGILLDAILVVAERAEKRRKGGKSFPKLVFVITGKGPQKKYYQERISKLKLSSVGIYILTMWLESADYPLLLGSADLGICLHTSSSGLDLPMKVVDMFGCGLPVCAVDFQCLSELVVHDKNGCVFQDAEELAEQMFSLFCDHVDKDGKELKRLGKGVEEFQALRWKDNWNECARPLFLD
jgi:beta-1,4-mannosyltransferase